MKIKIVKKYITFPVNALLKRKKMLFYNEGTMVLDLDVHLDEISPNFMAFVDVSRFVGMELEVKCDSKIDYNINQCDTIELENLYSEPYRPTVHFTVKNGWNNDPNGLVKYKDIYHMFYQYNPCSTVWDNMHWGHATSRDLLHWEELDVKLFPDEMGTMFSGGAIVDYENKTGLKENENDVILLFYTAAGSTSLLSKDAKFTQCLAYSVDGGKSFLKYRENPILEHFEAENRDPKVIWCDPINKYLMALFLDENKFLLLTSENLLDWSTLQELSIENEAECPDIFSLKVDGEETNKWVIIGAAGFYVIGSFVNGMFRVEQQSKRLCYGEIDYAAQSFSTDEERCIRISWHRMNIPLSRFSQQMGFPVEMNLKKTSDEYYLCATPINEISQLYSDTIKFEDHMIKGGSSFYIEINKNCAFDISLEFDYIQGTFLKLEIFGAEIIFDMENNHMIMDGNCSPLSTSLDNVDFRMIIDKCSVELFVDGGKFYHAYQHICDYNLSSLALSCDKDIFIKQLNCSSLKSIWSK